MFVAHIGLASATGLPAAGAKPATSLYPNPVRRGAPVSFTLPIGWVGARVEMLNAVGQVMQTTSPIASGLLPTGGLPAGLYTVRVRSATRQISRRLVVLE